MATLKKNEIELMSRYPADVDLQINIHMRHAMLNLHRSVMIYIGV